MKSQLFVLLWSWMLNWHESGIQILYILERLSKKCIHKIIGCIFWRSMPPDRSNSTDIGIIQFQMCSKCMQNKRLGQWWVRIVSSSQALCLDSQASAIQQVPHLARSHIMHNLVSNLVWISCFHMLFVSPFYYQISCFKVEHFISCWYQCLHVFFNLSVFCFSPSILNYCGYKPQPIYSSRSVIKNNSHSSCIEKPVVFYTS